MPRSIFTGVVVGIVIACLMGLRAVGHSMPVPTQKPWSQWSLKTKLNYSLANLHHSRFAIQWLRAHRAAYPLGEWRGLVAEHERLETKARRNYQLLWRKLHPLPTSIRGIICYVWGDQCSNALRVVQCESNFDTHNMTGDYWGLFQFGSYAREHYGFGWDAWTQTRAAKRLYDAEGWQPWECAYIVGIL